MVGMLLVLVLSGACGWVVGGSGRRVLPLQAGGLVCAGGPLVVGWLAVLVAPVVSGVGVIPLPILGSAVVGAVLVVVEGVDAVGGWQCCCNAAVGGAGDAEWAVPHPPLMFSENCVHQRRRRDCCDGLHAQQKTYFHVDQG